MDFIANHTLILMFQNTACLFGIQNIEQIQRDDTLSYLPWMACMYWIKGVNIELNGPTRTVSRLGIQKFLSLFYDRPPIDTLLSTG